MDQPNWDLGHYAGLLMVSVCAGIASVLTCWFRFPFSLGDYTGVVTFDDWLLRPELYWPYPIMGSLLGAMIFYLWWTIKNLP